MIGNPTKKRNVSFAVLALTALSGCNSANQSGPDINELTKDLESGQQVKIGEGEEAVDLRAFCPRTVIRAGTETYRTFEKGVSKDDPGALGSLRYQATVREVARECNYSGGQLNIRVGLKGRVINGPTGATGTIDTPIRVALVTTGNDVLYSQLHKVPVSIPEGSSTATFSFVDSNIFIPAPEKENLLIYVGFDEGPPESNATQ